MSISLLPLFGGPSGSFRPWPSAMPVGFPSRHATRRSAILDMTSRRQPGNARRWSIRRRWVKSRYPWQSRPLQILLVDDFVQAPFRRILNSRPPSRNFMARRRATDYGPACSLDCFLVVRRAARLFSDRMPSSLLRKSARRCDSILRFALGAQDLEMALLKQRM